MADIARKLANMVDVIGHMTQANAGGFDRALAPLPARYQHPSIHGGPDNRPAANKRSNLIIGELSLVVHQGPAVVVAGKDRPLIKGHCFVKGLIREMGNIEDNA